MSRQPAPRNVSDRLSAAPKQSGREMPNDSKLEPSKDLSKLTSLPVTDDISVHEGRRLDCFNQKPSSIVTNFFFITDRPSGAQIILDECTLAPFENYLLLPVIREPLAESP